MENGLEPSGQPLFPLVRESGCVFQQGAKRGVGYHLSAFHIITVDITAACRLSRGEKLLKASISFSQQIDFSSRSAGHFDFRLTFATIVGRLLQHE